MIADFLNKYRPGGPFVLTAIVPDGKTETRTFTDSKEAEAWALRQNETKNIYFHVNRTRGPLTAKAKKEDIAAVEYLHVDIDPRTGEDFEQERARILRLLTTDLPKGIPAPSLVIDSGGGFQAFWRLVEPLNIDGDLDKAREAERYNRALEIAFSADSCHDVSRIMRLPGTMNWPTKKKRDKGREPREAEVYSCTDASYPLTAFKPAPAVASTLPPTATGKASPRAGVGDGTAETENWIPGTASPFGTEELKAWAQANGKWHADEEKPTPPGKIGQRLLAVIARGEDPIDPTKYPSRSEAQFYVSCALARAGVPDPLHYRILTTPGSGVSESVLDKSDWHGYALKQINKAREEAEREWWRSEDAALNYLNNKHAVILDIGGKCRIIREVWDPAMKRTRISKQSFEDFRNGYRNRKVIVGYNDKGQPVEKAVGAWWVDHPQRRQYDTIVFAPGQEVEDAYNLWRGFAVEAREGDKHASFLAHVRDNVCSGNPEYYNYLVGWMARLVQEPDSPGEVAVVLRGGRGTGKSFFAKMFGRLFGRHFLQVSDSKHLVGNFNAHLRDTVLLFGDEAFFAGDKRHESVLKTLVTEEQLVIEGKGVDAEAAPNYIHLILASNEAWVVPAGLDERRFFVLEMSEGHKQDHAYFAQIKDDLYNGGLEHLLHFLLTYELRDFEVRRVPDTEALRSQKAESLQGFEAYLYDLLWSGELPKTGRWEGGQWFVFSTHLMAEAVEWLKDRRGNPRVTTTKIQKVLQDKLNAPKSRVDNLNGYYWDTAALRAAWNRSMFEEKWPPLPDEPDCPF